MEILFLTLPLETIIEYSKKNIEKLEENLKYTLNKELINIKMEEVNSVQKKKFMKLKQIVHFIRLKILSLLLEQKIIFQKLMD